MKAREHAAGDPRRFGLIVGGLFALIGLWPLLLRGRGPRYPALAIGVLLIVLALIAPRVLAPVERVWMKLGAALGWFNTRVVLAVAFYAIFTPLGLVLRCLGRDPIRRAATDRETFRVGRSRRPGSHMLHQF